MAWVRLGVPSAQQMATKEQAVFAGNACFSSVMVVSVRERPNYFRRTASYERRWRHVLRNYSLCRNYSTVTDL
jgi:hypothetical protein